MSYIGINPNDNIVPFIEKKPISSYPKSIIDEIKFISFSDDGVTTPFGSSVYRIQKYPGDIDVMESIIYDEYQIYDKFIDELHSLVNRIISSNDHYFSEFKCGIDERFDIDIGECRNGIYNPNIDLFNKIMQLHINKLIPDSEFNIFKHILSKNKHNGDDYDVINYILREHRILRWNVNEILNNHKLLPGNFTISLRNALSHKTPVKIDSIVIVENRFVEVTNFVMLGVEVDGKIKPLNLDFNLLDKEEMFNIALENMPKEIEKLYLSNMYYSPFKMIKRIYAIGRQIINSEMYKLGEKHKFKSNLLDKFLPLISSNISLMYQIKSELDTISLVLERVNNPPLNEIYHALDELKFRLSLVIEIDEDELLQLNSIFDDAINGINVLESIDKISNSLKYFINYFTIDYLNSKKINPPLIFFPIKLKYKLIKRSPLFLPKNPIKQFVNIH